MRKPLEHVLPRLLVEAGIASPDQAESLADAIAREYASDDHFSITGAQARSHIETDPRERTRDPDKHRGTPTTLGNNE